MKRFIMALAIGLLGFTTPALAIDIPIMDVAELNEKLGSPDLVVIDVRSGRDWSSSEFKITGADRQNPGAVGEWADSYATDKTIVLYCA